jgi:hypothetical protein
VSHGRVARDVTVNHAALHRTSRHCCERKVTCRSAASLLRQARSGTEPLLRVVDRGVAAREQSRRR